MFTFQKRNLVFNIGNKQKTLKVSKICKNERILWTKIHGVEGLQAGPWSSVFLPLDLCPCSNSIVCSLQILGEASNGCAALTGPDSVVCLPTTEQQRLRGHCLSLREHWVQSPVLSQCLWGWPQHQQGAEPMLASVVCSVRAQLTVSTSFPGGSATFLSPSAS